ncbi:MAG: sugar ABC transporter ATP-binding protein [Clostridia bacterium]|nr:sugar ABC transporter ATP-binding protein [Clostridia bacterium]
MNKPILELNHVGKHYGQHEVLKDINFSLMPGKILGIIGANGSGKSTLMNIIFGHQVIKNTGGYTGVIKVDGQRMDVNYEGNATQYGIGMVHQEFALFPKLTIAENIKLGNENIVKDFAKHVLKDYLLIDHKKDQMEAQEKLESLGLEIDASMLVDHMSISVKQFIEIARELDRNHLKLLILDEPTAVLNDKDSQLLITALKKLVKKGISVLFISHRLEEVMCLCDHLLVLRDGETVGYYENGSITLDQLAIEMIGEKVQKTVSNRALDTKEVQMRFENFQVDYPGEALENFSLEIYKGEVLGITSLSGHGKLAVAKGLIGFYPTRGAIHMNGLDITNLTYQEKITKGLYVLCEDRKNVGLLLEHSIGENIVFTAQQLYRKYSKPHFGGLMKLYDKASADKAVSKYCEQLDIVCRSHQQVVKTLSGGNQQKVCLARSLSLEPDILFVSEPTRGIDIAAKEKVLQSLIESNRKDKMTLVIASSELEELKRLCDRIVVLSEGRISAILSPDASAKEFGLAFSKGGSSDGL